MEFMSYKTYTEQIIEHLKHLQANGLDVTELKVNSPEWIRCHLIGESKGRGEFAYKTYTEKLNNGLLGIKTSFRGPNGMGSYKTYGLFSDGSEMEIVIQSQRNVMESKAINPLHEQAARKAYGFWEHSNIKGKSDYLDQKSVGYYRIRFRTGEEYGNVAVIPMVDDKERLWNYQLLNPNGVKRMGKDGRTEGLFHMLRLPVNGQPIGIAEGYVTSATCMEISGIPTVCAFSSENLVAVTKVMLSLFPASPIIIFADNDRHLTEKGMPNKGVLKAQEAKNVNEQRVCLVVPNFVDCMLSKEASDWNDLVRLFGRDIAKAQISIGIPQ
jgi:phage/plasmid primase-like uncharacterized protein